MSSQCHTDGYGIYLINEAGKELIGVREDDDRILYSIENDTVRICTNAFAKMKHLEVIELPASLVKIEENAFSHGPRDLHFINHSLHISYENDFLMDLKTHAILFYTGHEQQIILPADAEVIDREAFRGCTADTIEISDQIREIHEDAFTTCRMARVSFTRWKAYVYFPQKDIRLRQHMLAGFGMQGIFDFERYDNDLLAGFIEDERMKMIAARLKWPLHLKKETEEKYRALLTNSLASAVRCVGEAGDLFTLQLLLETKIIHQNNIEECLEVLHAFNDLEPYAYVSDYQNKHFVKKEFDFDI